jgi:hypothetical protein
MTPTPHLPPVIDPGEDDHQRHNWRAEVWRVWHDEGVADPKTGRLVRLTIRGIAGLWETTGVRVYRGIKRARAIREALAR